MQLIASKSQPPVGALITIEAVKESLPIDIKWDNVTSIEIGEGVTLTNNASIARFLARSAPQKMLYGMDIQSKTEIDHWITFTLGTLSNENEFANGIEYLNSMLNKAEEFLVGNNLTVADYILFGALFANANWMSLLKSKTPPENLLAWFCKISSTPEAKACLAAIPPEHLPNFSSISCLNSKKNAGEKVVDNLKTKLPNNPKDEGKFVDLPGAEMGNVVVRFPPEASGYLHIGHAKAALLNQHYQQYFNGKLIMRFDDTNPAKEKEAYETVILEDLKTLKVKYDHFSRTSDHFETIMGYCEKLLKEGKAYVDDTDAETMKVEREARQESRNRNNTVDKNLSMWSEMKKGSDLGLKYAARSKIDMQSDNGCMRDPTIYRCKTETHPTTGNKYNVYPTYDFACPIVDSIEGVTHSLRTTEYMDRDEQFNWFIDALGIRKPNINAYARLNLTNTVMSKRKLTWFVENGLVDGWDDPRLPTVRGIIRRGLTVDALKQFIVAQGSSRSVVFMEWDKIWAINKKIIDPIVPRYTAVQKTSAIPVYINGNVCVESVLVDKHPKDKLIGQKTIWKAPTVMIDYADATCLKEGENTTFINWGNLIIQKINRENENIISVHASTNLANTDYKKTLKLTWLAKVQEEPKASFTPTYCIYYDHLISKSVLQPNDDFKDFVVNDNKLEVEMLGDPSLKLLNKGDIIQLQRKGFFIVDVPYKQPNVYTCKPGFVRLIAIPDGTPESYGPPSKAGAKRQGDKLSEPFQSLKQKKTRKTEKNALIADKIVASKIHKEPASANSMCENTSQLNEAIIAQGSLVRQLKADKSEDATLKNEIEILLGLKAKYKKAAGNDWKPKSHNRNIESQNPDKVLKKQDSKNKEKGNKAKNDSLDIVSCSAVADGPLKQTRLGMEAKKSNNFAEWYSQIIVKSEMLEYYDVSGCYILRPWAYSIWKIIQSFFDEEIMKLGVEDCYFPMFVSNSALEKEKAHITDFAPEVAWVTKSGESDLAEPVAIRPTSETVMYPAYSKWIQSHRDLPLKLNQWNNVVRWEFKHPQPFLRTREFLWQEGHTAFAAYEEAKQEVFTILDLYRHIYEEILAVPVICGRKTEKEKFAGAEFTLTTEAYIAAAGRAIQGATSHHLGQNFSKMFDIVFEDKSGEKRHVYQNSWGFTTRSIGVLVMTHGDDKGLVLPPKAASIQVVIVPCGITVSMDNDRRNELYNVCQEYEKSLKAVKIRVRGDYRENYSPGWKYNYWELKGVPIRIEIGPRDIRANQFVAVRRDTGEKIIKQRGNCGYEILALLTNIQDSLFRNAKNEMDAHTSVVENWASLVKALDKCHIIQAPFCGKEDCEDQIKDLSKVDVDVEPGAPSMGAKSLCIPSKQPKELTMDQKCVRPECQNKAKNYTLFGRSY